MKIIARVALNVLIVLMLGDLCACDIKQRARVPSESKTITRTDSSIFFEYLVKGNRIYARKEGFNSFGDAIIYFDSAQLFAEKKNDSLLIGEAIFAKARVYDAWNKDLPKTIQYFSSALDIIQRHPRSYRRTRYVKHLLAHAYDKANDSFNTCRLIEELYHEFLPLSDSAKQSIYFIPEMAAVAADVHNYRLAEKILDKLYKREWITNDTNTYNYLDHYYLTQSKIAVRGYHQSQSPYLDSCLLSLSQLRKIVDSLEYSKELVPLFEQTGDIGNALLLQKNVNELSERVNNVDGISSLENRLLQSELAHTNVKLEMETKEKRNKMILIFVLSIAIFIILMLTFRLYYKNKVAKQQSLQLKKINLSLDSKVAEIALLNKEMQHRIKNNLQTIFSLLQMQERNAQNRETIEELQQARLRIESIALLHEQLIKSGNASNVNFKKFVTELVNNSIDCFANDKQVTTHLVIGDIEVSANINFSLALILNEWVTNSLKYAQVVGKKLTLRLEISQSSDRLKIEYSDNGQADIAGTKIDDKGLGAEIVQLLCQQMEAVLKTENGSPYHYTLLIPDGR